MIAHWCTRLFTSSDFSTLALLPVRYGYQVRPAITSYVGAPLQIDKESVRQQNCLQVAVSSPGVLWWSMRTLANYRLKLRGQ